MEFLPASYDYDHQNFDQRVRLDLEWTALCALRDIAGIAIKGREAVTYSQALALGQTLLPDLYNPDTSLLLRQSESDTTREFRQKAAAVSKREGKSTDPLDLLKVEIDEYDALVKTTSDNDKLRKRLSQLYKAQEELQHVRHPEHDLIFHDVFRAGKELPISGSGRNYVDYVVDENRVLRIRSLHPNTPEHLTGADVLYENYWDSKRVVRLAAIQYKVWEHKTLYHDDRMEKQIDKMHQTFCTNKLCEVSEKSQRARAYRLPYCAAFFRPTDRLQSADSRLISTGYHIPACVIQNFWKNEHSPTKNISSAMMRSESVTHKVFEEMFNTNMLGSRFLTYEELEKLYREHKVLEANERIIIHCQEYGRRE